MLSIAYLSRESWVSCLLLLCSLIMCANNRVQYDAMVIFVCCTSNYIIFIIMQTYLKVLVHSASGVCLRLSIFSQLSVMQYMEPCVFSVHIFLMMIVRIRVLYLITNIKSEMWPICHCIGLGHEAMVCALCIFYIFKKHIKSVIRCDPRYVFIHDIDILITHTQQLLHLFNDVYAMIYVTRYICQ